MPRKKKTLSFTIPVAPRPYAQLSDLKYLSHQYRIAEKYTDCMLAFISFIYRRQVSSSNRHDSSALLKPARVSSYYLRNNFFASNANIQRTIIRALTDEGLLKVDESYSTTLGKCKGYSLQPIYPPPQESIIAIDTAIISHRPTIQALQRLDKSRTKLVNNRTRSLLGPDSVLNLEQSLTAIDTKELTRAGVGIINESFRAGEISPLTAWHQLFLLASIESGQTALVINGALSRVTSNFNQLSRALRGTLKHNREKGVEIDLSCSQPSLLPVLYRDQWSSTRQGGFEIQKWSQWCRHGVFYDEIAHGLGYSREATKKQYSSQFVAYRHGTYRAGTTAPLRDRIRGQFPVLFRLIQDDNKNDHALVIRKLQRLECELLLTACDLLQRCSSKTIPMATIHDAIWVPRWAVPAAKQALGEAIERLNAPVSFKVKPYEGSFYDY